MERPALINHFYTVADSSEIPILLYNMPACTGLDLDSETIAALAKHENIIGLKDSGGNIVKIGFLNNRIKDFQILAGSGSFLLPALSAGAVGGILALANIAPVQCLAIQDLFFQGKINDARKIQNKMIPVNTAITSQWGVPALKAALEYIGLYGGPVRSPLLPLAPEIIFKLEAILQEGQIRPLNENNSEVYT
jgi:4-hydroxy-2-oxoglutarate aldolase